MDFDRLAEELVMSGVQVQKNEPMSRHTTFKVGGRAALFVRPDSVEAMAAARRLIREAGVRCCVVGRGSNLLVEDGDLPLAVVQLSDGFSGAERDGSALYAKAGTPLMELCRFARDCSLTGLEFAYGIPGAVGGGVYMNAGAYGGELSDRISRVDCMDGDGRTCAISRGELDFGYRHSGLEGTGLWITGAEFALSPGNKDDITTAMEDVYGRRRDKQPLEYPSAGSTFKRPAGAYAAELIDRCGLKGFSVGGAQVSEKHAGFVINRGGATCAQILELIGRVRDTVREKTGFELEREVKVLGADGEK